MGKDPRTRCGICGGLLWRAATRKHHVYSYIHLKCYVEMLESNLGRAITWMLNVPKDSQLDAPVPSLGGMDGRDLITDLKLVVIPRKGE